MTEHDATGVGEVHFEEHELWRAVVPRRAAPDDDGCVYQIWDYALVGDSQRDLSAGVTVRREQDPGDRTHLYITEIVYGHWEATELVQEMVEFARKHSPRQIIIEKLHMWTLLQLCLKHEAERRGVELLILKFVVAPRVSDGKRKRIEKFQKMFDEGRVHFVNGSW